MAGRLRWADRAKYVHRTSPPQDACGFVRDRPPVLGRGATGLADSRQAAWRTPRRHRSTVCRTDDISSTSCDQALVKDAVELFGRPFSGSFSKQIRIGIETPSPTAI